MPILAHAKKALRSSARKAEFNRRVKSIARTMVSAVRKEPTEQHLAAAYEAVDKAAKRKVFHHNKAARIKSQLAKLLVK